MQEEWRAVVGYEGLYWVSNHGRIVNRRVEMMNPLTTEKGYLKIGLTKQNKSKQYKVHRLVLAAFVGPCPEGMQCRHLDGNPKNNRLDNICWGTSSANQKDRTKHGTDWRGDKRGTANGCAKLSEDRVRLIRSLYVSGKYTTRELSKMFSVSGTTIWDLISGKTWRHVT